MNLALLAAGAALLIIPVWTARLGRRLVPRDWARLTAASMWMGLLAVRVGLLVTAAPTVLRAAGVHELAAACHEALGPLTPGGAATDWTAATAVVLLQARILRARHRSRSQIAAVRVDPSLGLHHDEGTYELVIVPAPDPLAFAVGGPVPQVVLSEGLVQVLSEDELEAVIGHERCHLRHRHDRYTGLGLVVDAAFGPVRVVRRSTAVMRLAVERWADEAAADETDRFALRNALEKVVVSMLDAVPAFTTADTICERLDALDTGPRHVTTYWRCVAALPAFALIAAIAVGILSGSIPVHHGVLGLLGYCPV